MSNNSCVSEPILRAFVLGELPDREGQEVEDHLNSCRLCAATCDRLDTLAKPLVHRLRQALHADTSPSDCAPTKVSPSSPWQAPVMNEAPPPKQVGGYEIGEAVGRGGIGVVFKAWDPRLSRTVALKMVQAGMIYPEVLERFQREAELMARLQHPHVAQVFEAGVHDGAPFLVMEYVAGGNLAQHLGGTPLPARPAARLLEALARAVDSAHQCGVIHRDLKPANILLDRGSRIEDRESKTDPSRFSILDPQSSILGVPKITDFGLAKLLEGGATLTQSGAIMGTPSYMAPEQASGESGAVGPAADVYALGAILYEALTGRPPFKAATALETMAQVTSAEPVAPRSLQPAVPRDLETICLKCLRKEPPKRYASAQELAEDLRRWQAGESIQARPVPLWERGLKWSRRRPGMTAALALGALLVVGLAASTVLIAQRERAAQAARDDEAAQRRRAEANERQANQERQIAQAVRDFLQHKLLGQADAREQADSLLRAGRTAAQAQRDPTIRELLDRAAAELTPDKIEDQFPQQPAVQAEILHTIGATYRGVGAYEPAIAHLTRARELCLQQFGPDHPDTLATLNDLAGTYRESGQLPEAIRLFEQVRDTEVEKLGPDHPKTLSTLNNLAVAYLHSGRTAEAIRLLEQVRDQRLVKRGSEAIDTLSNLALAYQNAGRGPEAIQLFEQVRDKRLEKLGPDHPLALTALHNLAGVYQVAGRTAEAIPLLEQVRDKQVQKLGPDHPLTLTALHNLGFAYVAVGRCAEAIALLKQVRDKQIETLSPDHPDMVTTLSSLARAYYRAGQIPEAIELFEQVRDKRLEKLGPDHPATLIALNNLAALYQVAGRSTEAIPLFEQVHDKQVQKLGPDHPATSTTLYNLARTYQKAQRFGRAVEAYRKHLEVERRRQPLDAPHLTDVLNSLGSALLQAGQPVEAESMLRESLAQRTSREADAWTTFDTQSWLGAALLGQRKYAEAEPLLRQGYEGIKQRAAKIPASAKECLPLALERLVQLYDGWEKKDQAASWRKELEAVRATRKGSPP